MGAGASSTQSPAVVQACTALFAALKTEYDQLVSQNANPDALAKFVADAQQKMKICAENSAKEKSTPAPATKAAASAPKALGKSKSLNRSGQDSGPKKIARRRSYNNNDMTKLSAVGGGKAADPGLVESASSPALDSVQSAAAIALADAEKQLAAMQMMNAEVATGQKAENLTDHWDSVRDLPFCSVCQMAFKTLSALDRHVKYSNLHEATVAKKKAEAEAPEQAAAEKAQAKLALLARQEEGKDFRLLYYGSKFFWRTQDNIDISFYQHIMLHIIEIIPFDVHKNKELERIYLDKFIIDTCLESSIKDAVKQKEETLRNEASKQKFTVKVEFNADAEFAELQRVMTTTYILSRLQLQVVQVDKHATNKLMFHLMNTDDASKDPLLKELPDMLVPVSVTHRRNTSSEEVKAKMEDLASDQAALRGSIAKAEKVSTMVRMFLRISQSNQKYKHYSAPKRKFVMAIKKIMQINGVQKTRRYLEALAKAKSSPVTKTSRKSIITRKSEV